MTDDAVAVTQHGHVKVYSHPDGTYTVSDNGTWLPGIYATEEAAQLAVDLPDAMLCDRTHWGVRGSGTNYRPVTTNELLAWQGPSKFNRI